jgi:hypothetical protein
MGFTSKLQGRKILTCCKFCNLNLTFISYSSLRSIFFFNFNTFRVIFQKLLEIDVKFKFKNVHHVDIYLPCNFEVNMITHLGVLALWEFPIGSYVKLSSAVAAILVSVLKCGTQFWKRTTQESFQQSLVEIGSIVSEENIFS